MRQFWKGIASVLFYVISGALMIYAASRSLDFITQTLPPEQQLIGYLALAATGGGMIAWLLVFIYKAEGLGQKIIGGLMVGVDLLGEFILFTMDSLYRSGQKGMITSLAPEEIRAVILGMSGLIALNIIATVAFHLVDGENIRNMRESFVRDRLENEALKLIEKRGDELARNLAPAIAEAWAADFEARFSDMRSLGLGTLSEKKTLATRSTTKAGAQIPGAIRLEPASNDASNTAPVLEAVPVPLSGFSGNGNGHK
ncbi:MAG TPA: hypothetical protein VGK00_03255 [Anaerolineales bacterium]|jgi:hypothetical protein